MSVGVGYIMVTILESQSTRDRQEGLLRSGSGQRTAKFAALVTAALHGTSYVLTNCYEAYIYRPGEYLSLGMVGVAEGGKYYVRASTIANNKFSLYSQNYYTRFTQDEGKAVGLARAFLRPAEAKAVTREVVGAGTKLIRDNIGRLNATTRVKLKNFMGVVQHEVELRSEFIEEIRAFPFSTLRHERDEFFECYDNLMDVTAKARGTMDAVVIEHISNEDVARTVEMNPAFGASTAGKLTPYMSVDQLSDDIKRKVSTLRMLEDGGFVPGLGAKIDSKAYVVMRG